MLLPQWLALWQLSLPTIHTALNIAATETAKWIVRGRNEDLESHVVSVNLLFRWHDVVIQWYDDLSARTVAIRPLLHLDKLRQ